MMTNEMLKKLFLTILCLALSLVAVVVVSNGLAQSARGEETMETAKKAPEQPEKTVKKTEEEWKKELTPEQFAVLRKSGTESPHGKVYKDFKEQGEGTYYCAGCNAELFSSKVKFDARCGWPSFYDPSKAKNVKTLKDFSGGMVRIEVQCALCEGHLGHIFEGEGYDTPTDQRYCINGIALKFVPGKVAEEKKEEPEKK